MQAASPHSGARTHTLGAMSTALRAKLTPQLMATKVDGRTLAGHVERQIVVRFAPGPAGTRVVPETQLAARLLDSPAGEAFTRYMHAMRASAHEHGAKMVLEGVRLLPDTGSIAAALLLDEALEGPAELRQIERHGPPAGLVQTAQRKARANGAWYDGVSRWMTIGPEGSRALLTSIGAYTPKADEPRLRNAGRWAERVPALLVHEAQHAVTHHQKRGYVQWLEEGIADALSETPYVVRRSQRAFGITPHSYAGHLGAPDHFDPGWGSWSRPASTQSAKERRREAREDHDNYERAPETVRQLVRLAGADLRTGDGWRTARQLLQAEELQYVPDRLAEAIIDRHALDPELKGELRTAILDANRPGGVRALVERFIRPASR